MAETRFSRLLTLAADAVDRRVGWHRLPRLLGVLALAGLRTRLRQRNLHDVPLEKKAPPPPADGRYLRARTVDGTYNDLKDPTMGSAGTPFGRNVPLQHTHGENDWTIRSGPNPRIVSRELLTRHEFQAVDGLNLLAASWLQFMVRDWLSHRKGNPNDAWELHKEPGDDWPDETMKIPRTPKDADDPPVYANTQTHWWDASQIYGSEQRFLEVMRGGQRDGKVNASLRDLPRMGDKDPVQEPGFWLGLAMLHELFTKEHNEICEHLREEYPSMSDEDLFDRARLVNAALLAKIHTVEWTPAILGHPTLQIAMKANWWGLATEHVRKLLGRVSTSEVISGIPGSETNHFDVPYSITEEFVAVYRMHPLIPDDYTFRSAYDNVLLEKRLFPELMNQEALNVMGRLSSRDLFYSFGTMHPGRIRLHNYPKSLQRFERPDGFTMDLGATDILRARELGVPRYNDFRRLLRLRPAETFEDLTEDETWAAELRRVYGGDVESVDVMIGMYAEKFPKGFGFSETAFRIFILMASRRLNSDRFFTTHYTPEVYTKAGMRWIQSNTMTTVLMRHYPGLRPSLEGIENAFFPWEKTGPDVEPAPSRGEI